MRSVLLDDVVASVEQDGVEEDDFGDGDDKEVMPTLVLGVVVILSGFKASKSMFRSSGSVIRGSIFYLGKCIPPWYAFFLLVLSPSHVVFFSLE